MSRKHRIHLGDQVYDCTHKLGAFIYLRVRDESIRGQVTGYRLSPGLLAYVVTWPHGDSSHYDFELSTSPFVMDTEDNDSEEGAEDGQA